MTDCKHESVFHIGGKVSDMCNWTFPNGNFGDGYVPSVGGVGGGDYLSLRICMTCHVVLRFKPEDVLALQEEAEADEEDWVQKSG